MDSLRCDLVDARGNDLLTGLSLTKVDGEEIRKVLVTPPNSPFKIRLRGQTQSGFAFERMSRGLSRPESTFMRATFAGNEATATFGRVSPSSQRRMIRRGAFIQLSYDAPRDRDKQGKTESIVVTVTSRSGVKFSTYIRMLLV